MPYSAREEAENALKEAASIRNFFAHADHEYDPLFDAQLEAHDACKDMIDTMAKHLQALEFGTLTEEQRHSLPDETDNLMKTVKLKMEKV